MIVIIYYGGSKHIISGMWWLRFDVNLANFID